jgi:hypothetical protein
MKRMNLFKPGWIGNYQIAVVLAAITGALVYYIAKQISEHIEVQGASIFYGWLAGTFLAAFMFGLFYSRAALQWGIYVLLGQIIFTVLFESGDANQLPIGVALYIILLIPMLLVGAIGGYLARKNCKLKLP